MTDYLRLAQQRAPQAMEEQDNPYMPLAKQAQEQGQNRARTVIEMALKDDPEIAAERLRLSQSSGLPPDVVQRNLEELRVKERARAVDLVTLAQESPILYRQIVDPNFATTSIDDLDTLKNIERAVGKGVRYMMGADGKGGLPSDAAGFAKDVGLGATVGTVKMSNNVAATLLDFIPGGDNAAAYYRNSAKQLQGVMDRYGSKPTTSTGQAVQSGAQSAGQNLAMLPLGLYRAMYATANQAASTVAGLMATGVGAEAFSQAREQGRNEAQALTYAIPQGTFEYVFEKIPAAKLFGDIAANTGLLKTIGKQTISEGWTEQLTTLTQDFNEWMNLNPEKTLAEFINERPEAAYQTFIATLVGVGVQTTTIRGINKVIEQATNESLVFEQDLLAEQMALASQSLLRQRSPEQFRAHVQQVVEGNDGAKKEIYVDGEVLNQLPEELLAQLPESVREAIPEAVELRSTVAIPMADVLTIAPGTELEQILNDNARMRPNTASRLEAQMAAELIQQEAERVLEQAADQTVWQQSSMAVKQTILDQLTATGRFTPDVNEAYATLQMHFFSTMAARTGKTPEQMYQDWSLAVAARGQGGNVLNATRPGALTVEGFHYSKEARPIVSTAMFGTGLQGSNRDQYLNAADKRLRKRAYFYVDKGTGINPESGVGGIAQKAQLTNVYDADADPLRLKKGGQLAFESAVLDAGFSGYLTRMEGTQSGQVIMLGDQLINTEAIGPATQLQGQVVPAPQARESLGRDVIVDALNAAQGLPSGSPTRARWSEILQAQLPEAHAALQAAGVFEGRATDTLYKSDLIKEFENKTEAPVYNQSLSSRLPGGKKATEDPLADTLAISWDVAMRDEATLAKNVAAMQAYPNFPKLKGKGAKSTERNAEAIIQHMVDNLLWLHDHMDADWRERARLWYDGGRKTVEAWADRYGITEMQGAAAIAVLSPQNGWFANVSQAERIMDMVFGLRDFAWDDAMTAEAQRISSEDGLDDKMKAAQGKTLGELLATPDIAARWIRVYDQTYNNRAYRVLTPEGGAADFVKTGKGTDATMMWKSYSTIAKAVSVLMDGRAENVHYQIGKEHKVRNFYNNIFAPDSELGYATIDTHAVAAALLRPLASADTEVGQAFGGAGSSSTLSTGLNGTYPIYWEAYRRAAEARGIQPRQMQSITWEAVRGLFEAAQKKSMKASANAIWERFRTGEITQAQAQQEILALAGDITAPSWTEVPFNDTPSRTYEGPAQIIIDQRGPVGKPETPAARVMFEVAPDPNDAALTAEWNALSPEERLALSQQVAADIVPKVLKELGTGGDFVMQLGGYMGATNPSMTLRLERPELALTAAKLLGFALAQDSMMVVSENQIVGTDEVGAVTVKLPEGYGEAEVAALYDRLYELQANGEPLVGGHTTADGQMVILNYSPLTTEELAATIFNHLGAEFDVDTNVVYSAFPTKDNYGYGQTDASPEGDAAARQSPAQKRPDSLRGEATQQLRTALDARRATDAGGAQTAELNQGEFEQGPRGTFNPQQLLITLNENADLSTFLHESGHFFLEVMADLASQPNAPQQIKDDMAKVLAWFGVPDLATWNNYTLDEKRPYHEKWAESFEQYLFEGRAPSIELQPLFRRFRSWLVNVYKSLTHFMRGRNLQVNDEIRQVFGRMVATDEQIAQAEEAAGMLPDFDATNEAIEKLQARSLRDLKWTIKARDKYIKQLTKEAKELRKGVEAEVRKEVEAQPLYRAINWLKKGETIDPETGDQVKAEKGFRLSTEGLAEIYPETMLSRPDLTKLRGMTAKEGLHPDMVAEMFGFKNGDHLVRSILDAEPISSVVEGMTDQRMLERHGDLATPEAIAQAANEAVHNEARARSLATELKSQAEMMNPRQDTGRTATNGRAITVNAITQAAKEFAANIAARRRIKDLKNAAWQHRSAEARAGKRWQEATAKGETQAAVQAKRDQLLNNLTVKALQEAQAEARKILEFFKRVTKDSNEKTVEKGRDPDVVNAMRAILAAYDVAPRLEKSALEYMELVGKNDPQMYSVLKPVVDGLVMQATPLTEMTMEQLRGLNDELRAMWVLAKRSRQMEVDGNLLDIEEAADELVTRMDAIGIPDKIPGEQGAITDAEERGIKLRFARAILTRVEQWAERLDGSYGGPFLRLVFQPVKDAADRYRTAKVEYRQKFTELLKGIAPMLPPGSIDAPELGYTFGNARDSGTAELLHAILHTGNDSNKRKLLLGRGWATENADGTLDTTRWDQFMQRMHDEGRITKAHYDFAQGVWDLLEQTKPLAQETHRKVFGRYFAEITANPVDTPFGQYRGGYVPAQTDSRLVKDAKLRELAEGENESMAYAFPASPSGFTKSRVEYNKPLLLDIRALAQHMDKVLLFSHMQGAVTDVRRLLTNKRVSYALDRIDPGAYEGMLIPWLNRAAKQIVETPVVGDRKLSRFLSAARSRAGMALMFANLSNTAQQITGFSLAAVKVKPGLLLSATAQFIADPKATKQTVADASAYMKDRMLNEVGAMNDVVEEILVNPTLLERGQAWTNRHAYFLQAAVDNTMSPIVWTAAYNQAIQEGQGEKDAVRYADGVVRQTQGTTLPEDVSRFESGPGYARLFTQFVSYFNMMANTNATAMKQVVDEMGLRKGAGKLVYIALTGLLVNIWVAEAIAQAFRGGPEDDDGDGYLDDWLAAVFGLGTVRGLVAQVPIVGQAAQLVVNRFNDNPADDKFSLSPAVSLIESAVSSPASVYKAIADDGNAQKAVRDVAAAATLITGLPFYAAARPVGYLSGVAQDKIDPTGPVDLARGVLTGTASPESKQR